MKLPRVSRKTWVALGLLVVLVAVLILTTRRREGMESSQSPGILYGPAIRVNDPAGVPIQETRKLVDGRMVYLAEDDGYVKMVTDNGEGRYFTGRISQFDPTRWESYTPNEGYKLKLNTPSTPPPPVAPPTPSIPSPSTPSSSANYSATCTKCSVINNQITCACDVLPK